MLYTYYKILSTVQEEAQTECDSHISLKYLETLLLNRWRDFCNLDRASLKSYLYRIYSANHFGPYAPFEDKVLADKWLESIDPFCRDYISTKKFTFVSKRYILLPRSSDGETMITELQKNWGFMWKAFASEFMCFHNSNVKRNEIEIETRYYVNLEHAEGHLLIRYILDSLKQSDLTTLYDQLNPDQTLLDCIASFKFSGPGLNMRMDAVVIYTSKLSQEEEDFLIRLIKQSGINRVDSIPYFTLGLAPGIAKADQPPNHLSFGQVICSCIAEAIIKIQTYSNKTINPDKVPNPDTLSDRIKQALLEENINYLTPHQNDEFLPTQPLQWLF